MDNRFPFEMKKPGTWLQLPDKQASWEVQTQLGLVESAFAEAAMAVMLFENSTATSGSHGSREQWEADSTRRAELVRTLEAAAGVDTQRFEPGSWDEIRIEADRQLMIEKLQRGIVPDRLQHSVPFLYAKAFLYAADEIGKVLDRLADRNDLPEAALKACCEYYTSFPSLREVRNSAQHVEDRGRGLGRRGQPLELKPVDNAMVKAPGGVLVMNSLNGNRFGATMADGHYGEVEVGHHALAIIRDHIESVLETLPWQGPEQRFP